MFHPNRHHQIREVATFAELARLLALQPWPLCQGFQCGTLLVLNDSPTNDPDRDHEWAVLRGGRQIESITSNVHDDPEENAAEVEHHLGDLDSGTDPGVDQGAVKPRSHLSGACPLCE